MTKPEKDALRELLNIAPYGLNPEVRSKNPNLVNSLVASLTGYNLMPYYVYQAEITGKKKQSVARQHITRLKMN